MTKSTKSQQGGLAPSSFRTTAACTSWSREPCVASACGKETTRKSVVSRSPQFQPYHACEHITRKSRADSCTHCLHARYKCKAGVDLVCSLTGWELYLLSCLLDILGLYLVEVGETGWFRFGCRHGEACALTGHGDMLCFSLIPIPYPPQSTNSFAYTNTTKGHKQ